MGEYVRVRRQRSAGADLDLVKGIPGPAILAGVLASSGGQHQAAAGTPPALVGGAAGHRFGDYTLLPQRALSVSEPGDADERAADHLADRVLRTPPTPHSAAVESWPATGAMLGAEVHRQAIPGAGGGAAPASALPAPGGSPLTPELRHTLEPRFGHDFSRVRVHADAPAAAAATALDARAFTVGHDVVFAAGQFAPHTPDGQRLLAHELAHVVQTGGEGTTIHRWHDDGHMLCARDAANVVFVGLMADSFFATIGMDKDTFVAQLEDASCNMDRVKGHIQDRYLSTLPAFGLSLITSGIRNVFQEATGIQTEESKTRRGITGEGLDHGEAGNYQESKESAAPRNEAHSLKYAAEAVAAFSKGDYEVMINKLGDAVHVSADRGSHEEGGVGRGHDIRMPREDLDESGTDIDAGYMENWDDNDNLSLNPTAQAVGTQYTVEVLVAFFRDVFPLLAQGSTTGGTNDTEHQNTQI